MILSTIIMYCVLQLLLLLTPVYSFTPEIVIKGNKFFYSNNGTQFYIKGVAYQQQWQNGTSNNRYTDPLTDKLSCQRDIPFLKELDTNVIRVYAIDTSLNHDDCFELLSQSGIYVIADLSEPGVSITRDNPQWSVELYNRYINVVDQLHKYPNILGFFAGNEVTNNGTNTNSAPFVKAAVRDIKHYIQSKGYRNIPVGYSTNDDADTRDNLANYFNCGNTNEAVDFYGINIYEWCGSLATYENSGYADRTKEFANFTVPVFFSEYGCNVPQPRLFNEVSTLYGQKMSSVWSGGIVYMYFEEANNYGLVSVNENKVTTLKDFSNLSQKMKEVNPPSLNSKTWTPTNSVSRTCPTNSSKWKAAVALPPTPKQEICNCMYSSLSCIVSEKATTNDYEALFNFVCSKISCEGITGRGDKGTYGAFSFCDPKEKLSFVLNNYYNKFKTNDACNFQGLAKRVNPKVVRQECKQVLDQAGSSGTGLVSATIEPMSNEISSTTTKTQTKLNNAKTNGIPKIYLTIVMFVLEVIAI